SFGRTKGALGREVGLIEALTAPEHQADAVLQLAVADDGIAFDEPNGMPVPHFVLVARQRLLDLRSEQLADLTLVVCLRFVVRHRVFVHRHWPEHTSPGLRTAGRPEDEGTPDSRSGRNGSARTCALECKVVDARTLEQIAQCSGKRAAAHAGQRFVRWADSSCARTCRDDASFGALRSLLTLLSRFTPPRWPLPRSPRSPQ